MMELAIQLLNMIVFTGIHILACFLRFRNIAAYQSNSGYFTKMLDMNMEVMSSKKSGGR